MVVAVLLIVLAAGWGVWKHLRGNTTINSYKACADAGNPVLLSYPSICVTKDGRRFVNPDEHVTVPTQ